MKQDGNLFKPRSVCTKYEWQEIVRKRLMQGGAILEPNDHGGYRIVIGKAYMMVSSLGDITNRELDRMGV